MQIYGVLSSIPYIWAMEWLAETLSIIRKDIQLEWRSKYAIGGILLYVLTTVVVAHSALLKVEAPLWNALYWVIVLFAAVSAVVKSFVQESSARQLYYYSLLNPVALLVAKVVYNTLLLWLLSLLTWALMGWLAGNPVRLTGLFLGAIGLGGLGLSIALTFVSAISAKANNSATLLAVLGFPLIIPILLTLVKLGANAVGLVRDTALEGDIAILLAIDLGLLGMAIVLYPFLWRD
jgi:heme exporter protein B